LQARLRSALASFERPEIEPLALEGYRRERSFELSFPIAAALMEGGFIGVIADKVFQVHPAVLALITAAPMAGNLSSFLWARLAQGRRKIPLLVGLQLGFLLCVGAIALAPRGAGGAFVLVASLIVARLVLGGILTVRSLVWTLNYPRTSRARVTSRLAVFATFTLSLTAFAATWPLDADPEGFRVLYAVAALLGCIGAVAYARVPVLGEGAHLRLERAARSAGRARSEAAASSAIGLLREDPLYARYLSWQFLLGTGNMMVEAPLIYLVSRQLDASYTVSVAITVVIPVLFSLLTLPLWASWVDRVHIAEFRSHHSWVFASAQLVLWLGALTASLPLIALSRAILGIGRGGGMLAWQLGHNDFAERDRVGLYMGIHVTLTGVRGAIAPFVGMGLYLGLDAAQPGGGALHELLDGLGPQVMLVACSCSVVAALGFRALARRISAG